MAIHPNCIPDRVLVKEAPEMFLMKRLFPFGGMTNRKAIGVIDP